MKITNKAKIIQAYILGVHEWNFPLEYIIRNILKYPESAEDERCSHCVYFDNICSCRRNNGSPAPKIPRDYCSLFEECESPRTMWKILDILDIEKE